MLGQIFRDIFGASKDVKQRGQSEPSSANSDNPLAEYFYNNPGPGAFKWHHYFEIYHRHLQRFRQQSPVVLEIGVAKGGSLPMWHHYFGPGTHVIGVDIDPACRQFEDKSTTIVIGDQADRTFLATLRERFPHIDILIDDGGHTMVQQIATFEELYGHVQPDGVYLCEDMHTSLWANFGGGYLRQGTFLEYTKALVDRLFSWHSREPAALTVDDFTLMTHGMHFYDSVVVMEKRRMEAPKQYMTGRNEIFVQQNPPKSGA